MRSKERKIRRSRATETVAESVQLWQKHTIQNGVPYREATDSFGARF